MRVTALLQSVILKILKEIHFGILRKIMGRSLTILKKTEILRFYLYDAFPGIKSAIFLINQFIDKHLKLHKKNLID